MRTFIFSTLFFCLQFLTFSCSSIGSTELKFSTTQSWIPAFKTMAEERIQKSSQDPLIEIPSPPRSSSSDTIAKDEINLLLRFQELARSPEVVQQIMTDREIAGWTLGEVVLNDHIYAATPLGLFIFQLFHSSFPDIQALKFKFDRVRPLHFDKRIKPITETPGHASYPSGHSSSSFLISYLLSDILIGDNASVLCDAARIAVEREIAGLHYPSDSDAGQIWAKSYYAKWKEHSENKLAIKSLRKWWKQNRKTFLATRSYRKPAITRPPKCSLEDARSFYIKPQVSSENNLKT